MLNICIDFQTSANANLISITQYRIWEIKKLKLSEREVNNTEITIINFWHFTSVLCSYLKLILQKYI